MAGDTGHEARPAPAADALLRMDPAQMRELGYAAIDALVERLTRADRDPVLRRATPAEMRTRLDPAAPEGPTDPAAVLRRVLDDVLPYASRTDHPGYFAYIPSFTTWPAAVAELLAAAANPYCGAWTESAGPTQVELDVVDWFRSWLGMPTTTAGVLVSGGSAANLTALMVARDARGVAVTDAVVYVSDQGHSSLARTARALGLRHEQVRVVPSDSSFCLDPAEVAAAIATDRRAGRSPLVVCASAGATNTGAVDDLTALADVCEAEQVWLHVDAAYGGFAVLTDRGRDALSGIERADSVTLDPHKWLFSPMECGCVLVRDGDLLTRTFAIHPDYLDDARAADPGEVDLADRGLQLSRGFRALKVWMGVQTFGVAAFRAAIDRGLDLARHAEALVRADPRLELVAPATLGIVCFRRAWPGVDEAELGRRNAELAASLERTGRALVSSTRLHGRHAVRLCALNPTSGPDDVAAVVAHFAAGELRPPADAVDGPRLSSRAPSIVDQLPRAGAVADRDRESVPDRLAATPLFADVTGDVIAAAAAAGALATVDAGAVVVREHDTDRDLYVILRGTLSVTVDGREVRVLHPGDFFGELAARDWGGGYGYARLATVTATEMSELFVLPGPAFAALLDGSAAVRAHVDAAVRERLHVR